MFIVKTDVPVLAECAVLPPYAAVTVTEEGGVEDGIYRTEHLPDNRAQEDWLNVPPALPSVHVTTPDGIVGKLDVSVTDVVNCT
jgi:hypothetical protein